MANYYVAGVVRPANIPKKFVSDKDKETLSRFGFQFEDHRGKLYFYAEELKFTADALPAPGAQELSEDDMMGVFQGIIKQSKGKVPYLMLEVSYTGSKMSPDAFGGVGYFITADDVETISTSSWLAEKEGAFIKKHKRNGSAAERIGE